LTSAELYLPRANGWVSIPEMSIARNYATTTLLSDGRILVAGGSGRTFAELYDPRTQSWSFTGRMRRFRYQHAAVLLSNGKVLAVGGVSATVEATATVELYDPASDSWADAGSMAAERAGSSAVLLADGRVLVAGGFVLDPYARTRIPASTAEIYDPQTDRWSPAGPMHTARFGHTITLLPDGRVLVTGGHGDDNLASAEIYDPRTNSWSLTGLLSTPRDGHTATLLHNGKVLVVGGFSSESSRAPLGTAELFDPLANSWSPAASLAIARSGHAATLLRDGRVLVAGGSDQAGPLASVELYDPAAPPAKGPVIAPGVPGTTVVLAAIAGGLALLLIISFGFRRLRR
jgi:N-acetylneuraminic acid mutarotase